jgi:hypothetical protein
MSSAGRGFRRDLDLVASGMPLPGTGLDHSDSVTVLIEGEIYLVVGSTEIELDADDRGFFDLYDPATGVFERVVAGSFGPPERRIVDVDADGWYPFQAAFENAGGVAEFRLRVGDDGDNPRDVDPARLRVRLDGRTGLALDGFDDPYLQVPTGTTLTADELDAIDYGDEFPDDLGPLGYQTWSTRWSGEVLVEVAGDYAFAIDSEGGHRMWLDGVQVADTSSAGAPQQTRTPAVTLDAGWHQIAVDLMKDDGSTTYLQLTVADGPELVGDFFPVERTRPVIGRGARWAAVDNGISLTIPDVGSATRSVVLDLPQGVSQVIVADYYYALTHPVQSGLGVTLSRPGGANQTLHATGDLTGAGGFADRRRFDTVAGDGTWALTVTETGIPDLMTGAITDVKLGVTYAGGTRPYPTRAVYTSRIRELGPTVVSISGVRWQARQERDGGGVTIRVRSCDSAAACASEPWHDVARSGDVAGVSPRAFLQYQVEITTGGDVPTGLDWIEIDYRLP